MVAALVLLAAVSAASAIDKSPQTSVQTLLQEEPPDVFLAKATLQQYLSRVVRKDWDGVRRLTHPKTLAALESGRMRSRELAPWDDGEPELKTFRFVGAREVAPGVVLVEVGEDTYRREAQGMSVDDASVYVLFKSRGGFLVGDRKDAAELSEMSDHFVRARYPGYVDGQVRAQARRESARGGKHR
jgi:hypothetical protein